MTLPAEFGLIARHFRPLAGPGALDLLDDAAVVRPPAGQELVITADAIVAGVHFLPDDPPDDIARKLLRVSLSDLAAMGAVPWAYVITVSAPQGTPDAWFQGFAAGLGADQAQYGLTLLGGDTTSTPGPLSLTATLLGHVPPGQALRRVGAREGDEIWVTGTIGDGALGLAVAQGRLVDPTGTLLARYRRPEPRVGLRLHGIVSACMDVSDGLLQDAGHLCRAGALGAVIEAPLVPLSAGAKLAGPHWLETCLTGGDDYELLMAVPPGNRSALIAAAGAVPITHIGRFVPGDAVRVPGMTWSRAGWSHF